MNRRRFLQIGAISTAAATSQSLLQSLSVAQQSSLIAPAWKFKYMLASCMYGYMYVGEILPEVSRTGAAAIDIWPKVHGNQREQVADLGEDKFLSMLTEHKTVLGCITQYKLGPFGLTDEMKLAGRLGCRTIVTGGSGPVGLEGSELKAAVSQFIDRMKPHLDVARQTGVTIAIENHGSNLIQSPDSLKWLADLSGDFPLGIALAPYHLPQDSKLLAELIRSLGEKIEVFYAWQYGMGSKEKLPKEQEMLQMPGRGSLDFGPIVAALQGIDYQGWTEIFMHPVPRGVSILETPLQVSEEINRARAYLDGFIA